MSSFQHASAIAAIIPMCNEPVKRETVLQLLAILKTLLEE